MIGIGIPSSQSRIGIINLPVHGVTSCTHSRNQP